MNIQTHSKPTLGLSTRQRRPQPAPLTSQPEDAVTLRMSRSTKRKVVVGTTVVAGAALGSVLTAGATGALTGTAAKVAGGVAGTLAGAAALGVGGALLAGALVDDKSGFGGLAAAYAGLAVGGVVGGIGGAVGGAMLANGAGNALGYAAGALVGGTVGAFTAKGFLS